MKTVMSGSWRALRQLLIVAPLLLAACGDRKGSDADARDGVSGGAQGAAVQAARAAGLQRPDQMPVMNGEVVAALARSVPQLEEYRAELEARERVAIDAVMTALQQHLSPAKPEARNPAQRPAPGAPPATAAPGALAGLFEMLTPRAYAAGGVGANVIAGGSAWTFTTLTGGVADGVGKSRAGGFRSDFPGKSGADASIAASVDDKGMVTTELATKVDLAIFLMEANSKITLTTAGLCPAADGTVSFTIKLSQGGRAGSGGSSIYDRNREAKVRATVDDNAEIASADIDTNYAERSSAGGRDVYVEGATGWHTGAGGVSGSDETTATSSRVVRTSSQANASDSHLLDEGMQEALILGNSALKAAAYHWKSGACISIRAKSPGLVAPGATSQIPVAVFHKLDGSEIAAKLKAELTGGKSVTPTDLPRTPGTLTHVATSERKATMSILLTATSRRGKATETLKISINENQYSIDGGADEFHGTGTVCDLSQPFEVEGSGVVVKFVPSSDRAGSYTYSGSMSGFAVMGNGTYTVNYNGEVATGIKATGPGSVKTPRGIVTNTGTEVYTLEPTKNGYCY
jgi:hypothetical protein